MKKSAAAIIITVFVCFAILVLPNANLNAAYAYNHKKQLMVVLGDSIACGTVGLECSDTQSYAAILAKKNNYELCNLAVNGYATYDLLNLVQNDDYAKSQISKAHIILISVGGNDIVQNNPYALFVQISFNDFRQTDKLLKNMENNFASIIGTIREQNPYALIVVQNLFNPRYDFSKKTAQKVIDRINNVYETYLDKNPDAYILVDLHTAFEGNRKYIQDDLVHPSAEGHKKIAQKILAALDYYYSCQRAAKERRRRGSYVDILLGDQAHKSASGK